MKHIKHILVCFFLVTSTAVLAQEAAKKVKEITVSEAFVEKTKTFFKLYFDDIQNHRWEALTKHMPKEYLDIIGEESMTKQLAEVFDNEIFSASFNEMTYKSIASAFSYENVTYAKVNYYNSFTFNFKQTQGQTKEELNSFIDLMEGMYKGQFKGQTVKREGNSIHIKGDKVILIIDNPKTDALKMLEVEKSMEMLYAMFFPEAVVDKLVE